MTCPVCAKANYLGDHFAAQAQVLYFGLTRDHTWLSVTQEDYANLKPTHRLKVIPVDDSPNPLPLPT